MQNKIKSIICIGFVAKPLKSFSSNFTGEAKNCRRFKYFTMIYDTLSDSPLWNCFIWFKKDFTRFSFVSKTLKEIYDAAY